MRYLFESRAGRVPEKVQLTLDNDKSSGIVFTMNDLRTALKEAIRSAGKGLPTIADECGVDKGQLSRFMRDLRDVNLRTADKLLAGLGFTVRLVRARGTTAKGR
jgi:hypothetical protein